MLQQHPGQICVLGHWCCRKVNVASTDACTLGPRIPQSVQMCRLGSPGKCYLSVPPWILRDAHQQVAFELKRTAHKPLMPGCVPPLATLPIRPPTMRDLLCFICTSMHDGFPTARDFPAALTHPMLHKSFVSRAQGRPPGFNVCACTSGRSGTCKWPFIWLRMAGWYTLLAACCTVVLSEAPCFSVLCAAQCLLLDPTQCHATPSSLAAGLSGKTLRCLSS